MRERRLRRQRKEEVTSRARWIARRAQEDMEIFWESYEWEAEKFTGDAYRILEKTSRLAEILLPH